MDLQTVAQQLSRRLGCDRLRKQISLTQIAAQFAQKFELLRGFNAFGDYLQLQLVAQHDDEVHRVTSAAVGEHLTDKRAVDLQRVDRKLPQPDQRGVSCAEIVEDHANSKVLELGENRDCHPGVSRGYGFCHFELQLRRLNPDFVNCVSKVGHEAGVGKLPGGKVYIHRYGLSRVILFFPLSQLLARLKDQPLTNREKQARVFSRVDKLVGRNQTLLGMLPAEQGFESCNLPGIKLHDRLVMHAKLTLLDGFSQSRLQPQSIDGARMHGFIEDFATRSSERFCTPHCHV